MTDSFHKLEIQKVNPADIVVEYSSSIPDNFPKNIIPHEICDKYFFLNYDECSRHYYEIFK